MEIRKQINRDKISKKRFALGGVLALCLFFCGLAHAGQSISLAWDSSPDPIIIGYILHFGTNSGHYTSRIDVGTNTVVTISGLEGGINYYFVVTGRDSSNIETAPSNEAIFVAPVNISPNSPPPQIGVVSPSSAVIGGQVLIYGANLTGALVVQIGGVNSSFTIASDTLIVATVPANAVSGQLSVLTPSGSATAQITITPAPIPSNDNFSNAQVLTGSAAQISGSTSSATREPGEPAHAGNSGGGSVWYCWTAPASGVYSLDSLGSTFNPLLAIYTGNALSTLSSVASNRLTAGAWTNSLSLNATAGATYFIAVDAISGTGGNFILRLAPAISTTTIYSSSFEPAEAFTTSALAGQNGWLVIGTGHASIANNLISGLGQQAYLGLTSITPGIDTLLYRPLNYTVDTNSRPVIQFSVTMQVNSLFNSYPNKLGWTIRNTSGHALFKLLFDDSNKTVVYQLDNASSPVSTGVSFANTGVTNLNITMDFGRNRWSASLGATSLTREQPITAAGAALTLGDIAASWIFTDPNHPGNDDMVFDNYLVTAGPSLVPRFISGLSNQTVPVGASVFLAAVPSGTAPMSSQWYYNNGQIPNATNGNLTLPNVNPAQAGNYSLIVRNASGSATNSATITVSTPPPVAQFAAPPAVLPGAGAQLNLNLSAGNNYRLLASTNLTDWTILNSFYAAGGSITCFDPAATNYPCRFYRLVSP